MHLKLTKKFIQFVNCMMRGEVVNTEKTSNYGIIKDLQKVVKALTDLLINISENTRCVYGRIVDSIHHFLVR